MLRALHSRRRPRYGAHLCAVIAALLLLFSVTVLHSRLGFPFSSSVQHLHFPQLDNYSNDDDGDNNNVDAAAVVANPLLGDVDIGASGGAGNVDDRIDELDIVDEDAIDTESRVSDEEEILRGVDLEADPDYDGGGIDARSLSSGNARSGYFWDHVVGVRRRSFNQQVMIDPWDDFDADFLDFSTGSWDQSKIAFGSDDQPVDEDVRRKLEDVKTIEDALLLKTGSSKRSSALREGWANWFEKKGDFLRRDRMFKSNLEMLNPLNNPLLQDPDVVGLSSLTRGDKLMQKTLLNEFDKRPFVVKKTSGVANGADKHRKSSRVSVKGSERNENVGGRRNEMKGVEQRRSLYDNGGIDGIDGTNIIKSSKSSYSSKAQNGNNSSSGTQILKRQPMSSYKGSRRGPLLVNNVKDGYKVGDLPINKFGQQSQFRVDSKQIDSEITGPLYANGKRWGYFPGLDPNLSFSDFMKEFFRQGKCVMKVFMVWNSPPWMFSVRHQRGLESLLYHHPDACVVVFSETIELNFFKDFVKDGFKVSVAMPNLDELLQNTPAHVFASVWFAWRKTSFYSVHYSELVRLAALHKYGGVYLDCDVVVLKPLLSLHNSVGLEDPLDKMSLNGAVMAFKKNSLFILECLKEFYATYDDTRLRWNGADLLTRVSKKFLSRENSSGKQPEVKVEPSFIFSPIGPQNITRYFMAPVDDTEKTLQDILFKKILNESFTFHFWNSLTSSLVPEPESLVARLLNHHCIRCLDSL